MVDLPLLHPFIEEDLRERRERASEQLESVVDLWVDEAGEDHDLGRHDGCRHVWCRECEHRTIADDPDVSRDAAAQPDALDDMVERIIHGRARRWKILNGRPPSVPKEASSTTFDAGTLAEVLDRDPDPPMRVEGLIPWAGSTLIAAKRKTGKTTLTLNLARALITGTDFLDRFAVRKITGRVGILNYEVSGSQLARWADEVGVDEDRLFLVNLRGVPNPLRSQSPRAALAALLRAAEVETLIVDTFGRAYTGTSQNDAGEVTAFLTSLDEFARSEVGAVDLILTAHAGWDGERTRGSSGLEDWPDSIVTLTSDDSGGRFLRALGRDVDVDEDRLDFDPLTRSLAATGSGSRQVVKARGKLDELAPFIEQVVTASPGIGVAEMVAAIRELPDAPGFRDRDVSKAAQHALSLGLVRVESDGPGTKSRHYPGTPSNPVPTPSLDVVPQPRPPRLYRDGVGVGTSDRGNPVQGIDCTICQRHLGRADAAHGVCLPCRRVAQANARTEGTAS